MGWFRANRRGGGVLAFVALALQLVLAFGHVHVTAHADEGAGRLAWSEGSAATPGDGDGHGDDESRHRSVPCGICAALNLLGTAVGANAPEVALPAVVRAAPPSATADRAASLHRGFARSRAPPAV